MAFIGWKCSGSALNANFGLLDPLERPVKDKQKKRELLVERALHDIDIFARGVGVEVTA